MGDTRTRNPDTLTSKAIVICMWQQGWGAEWKEEEHFEDVMITRACLDSVNRCAFFLYPAHLQTRMFEEREK